MAGGGIIFSLAGAFCLMFLLGEYDDVEARKLANRLKVVGIKVEIRTFPPAGWNASLSWKAG